MRRSLLSLLLLTLARQAGAQCPDGTAPPCRGVRVAAAPGPNTVAVLYFENLGRDTSDAYIADGLTEEVTSRLGQVARLNVTSRTAVRRLRNAASMQTSELGRALNVSFLVNGSIRKAGDKLRVTVELVRASSGSRVWGDQFDRGTSDLLALQEDIARAVATGIAGQLLPAEQAKIARRPTRSGEAFDHYLRGRRVLAIVAPSSLGPAIQEFEAALRLDPSFTLARGFIAQAYAPSVNWNWATPDMPADTLIARGLAAADRAIREDSTSPDGWIARGIVLGFARPAAFEGSLESFRRAIALDSNNVQAFQWYAIMSRRLGHFDDAIAAYHRAIAIDPTEAQSQADLGFIAFTFRRFREAVRWYDSSLVIDAQRWQDRTRRAQALLRMGDTAAALGDARLAVRISGGQRTALAMLSSVEARAGMTASARERLDPLVATWRGRNDISVRDGFEIAGALVSLGDTARALDVLERVSPKGAWLWSYLLFADFDPLRNSPRFQRLFNASMPPGASPRPWER